MKVALYIRVSTEDQLEFSPDAQKRALIEYAKKNKMLVLDNYIFIDEGITGTSIDKRKAFQKMIATAKKKPKPFDAILVHKFDRFARSREDSVVYKSLLRKECGIKVISITEQLEDDKFSVILEAMLEAMAEYYSLNLSDEVMKGMTEKARRGEIQANPPYGYKLENGKYIIEEEEAKIIQFIFNKVLNGTSLTKICRELLDMGVRSKQGGRWISKRIKYVIQNPVYCGKIRWNYTTHKNGRKINDESEWIIVDGNHQAIISKDVFDKANKVLKNTTKITTTRPGNATYRHYLGGLLRCSTCEATLVYGERKRLNKQPLTFYRCNNYNKGACTTPNYINTKILEEELKNALEKDLNTMENKKYLLKVNNTQNITSNREILKKKLSKTKNKYTMAKKAYLSEIDTLEEYKQTKAAIFKEEQVIKNKLKLLEQQQNPLELIKPRIQTVLSMLDDPNINNEEKNNILKSFIDKIVIDKSLDTLRIFYFI